MRWDDDDDDDDDDVDVDDDDDDDVDGDDDDTNDRRREMTNSRRGSVLLVTKCKPAKRTDQWDQPLWRITKTFEMQAGQRGRGMN